MIKVYDPFESQWTAERFRRLGRLPLRHLASELVTEFGYQSETDLTDALNSAIELCCFMHISIEQHFKKVYLSANESIKADWLLSDLGSYLLLINGDIHNPNVAKARLYLALRATTPTQQKHV